MTTQLAHPERLSTLDSGPSEFEAHSLQLSRVALPVGLDGSTWSCNLCTRACPVLNPPCPQPSLMCYRMIPGDARGCFVFRGTEFWFLKPDFDLLYTRFVSNSVDHSRWVHNSRIVNLDCYNIVIITDPVESIYTEPSIPSKKPPRARLQRREKINDTRNIPLRRKQKSKDQKAGASRVIIIRHRKSSKQRQVWVKLYSSSREKVQAYRRMAWEW